MIAPHAQPIIDARLRGLKPDCMVLISMVGRLIVENPVVYPTHGVDYDWRWVPGLEVCVYLDERDDWVDMVKAIAKHEPEYLAIWNRAHQWGAQMYLVPTSDDVSKPRSQWEFELTFSPWLDFQNNDFVSGRTYKRDEKGMPYAVDP